MPTSSPSGRPHASARRPLLAALTAAFFVLQQAAFVIPAAAQVRRPSAGGPAAARLTPRAKSPAPRASSSSLDDPGTPNISVTTLGTPITQNFNTLATSGTTNAWTDDTTLPGWYAQFSATGQTANPTTYRADSGGSNTGAIYSWGVAGVNALTERAFGSVASGTPGDIYYGVKLTNNTGSTIGSLTVSYNGEQWRQGGCNPTPCTPAAQKLDFQYQVANVGVITDANTPTAGWLDQDALDFTSPQPGTSTAATLDGNAAANRTALSSTVTVTVNPGQEVWLRWKDANDANNDHGLALDDFSVTANAPPATPTLAVNDVSQDEGNAGTTAFTFTVGLSTTTHPAVTFDICTADGTAQDDNPATEDNDYAANCLTGQTIPNGSDAYQFTVNVNGDAAVEPNETFFVNVTSVSGATVADGQGQGTIQNDDITLTPIHDIQGNGDASPVAGQSVTTTGIVTLLKTGSNVGAASTANGFFLQSPEASYDTDPNTSEGVFVFTSSVPAAAVGDAVRVTGTVQEFNGLTEIGSVTGVAVLSTGNPLPADIEFTATDLDPTAAATQPQLEKYEGMRVCSAAGGYVTVAPNDNFFDVYAVLINVARPLREPGIPAGDPVPPDPTSGTPDPNIPIWDKNPERLKIDTNGRAGAANVPYTSNVTLLGVVGPLDYAFGEYRLVTEADPSASPNMSAVPVPTPLASEFTIAGYNIENFNNNATQRQKAALTIRNVLHYPDVLGAVEIFDLADLQALRDQINNDAVAAGDPNPQYEAYLVEQDGTSEDNDQDVGFLVKTSRVSVTSVTQEREESTFINPNTGNPETLHDRPPLVLDAIVDPSGAHPRRVIVVVNHLRSFIDIELVAGEGVRVREKRKRQAEDIADLLNDLQTANPGIPVISVGDYNAFQFSSGYDDPLSVIKGTPTADDEIVVDQSPDLVNPDFVNLIETLPAAEQYSFVFEGTPQALDHHVVNAAARARNTRIAIARVNSDFPETPAAAYAGNAATPERNSDHDPVVSYYSLNDAQPAGTLVISEFRFHGPSLGVEAGPVGGGGGDAPGGPDAPGTAAENDEFVEFYNNTDSDITVSTIDGSPGWALVAADGAVRFIIPNGTVIPARRHFLAANTDGYSLCPDPDTDCYALPDEVLLPDGVTLAPGYDADIPSDSGIALFRTANPSGFTSDERLDAVGYAGVTALYREGAGLPTGGAEIGGEFEQSWVRKMCDFVQGVGCTTPGIPKDSGSNASDFVSVDTSGVTQSLGAPGPESLSSPFQQNAKFPAALLDTQRTASQAPNRVRDFADTTGDNKQFGTMSIRRTFTNNTGFPISYLAFRVVQVTTTPFAPADADLRVLDSDDIVVTLSNGTPVDVRGTYVEQPPVQSNGGALNSSLGVGFINLGNSLDDGDSVNVQFLLGVMKTGTFRFYINIEAFDETAVPESLSSPKALKALKGQKGKPRASSLDAPRPKRLGRGRRP